MSAPTSILQYKVDANATKFSIFSSIRKVYLSLPHTPRITRGIRKPVMIFWACSLEIFSRFCSSGKKCFRKTILSLHQNIESFSLLNVFVFLLDTFRSFSLLFSYYFLTNAYFLMDSDKLSFRRTKNSIKSSVENPSLLQVFVRPRCLYQLIMIPLRK